MALRFDPMTGEMIDDSMEGLTPVADPTAVPAGPTPPQMNPQVKDYLMKKFNLGNYSNESRAKLLEDSAPSTMDKAGAALAAIGAGFSGRDAAAAGMNKLAAARQAQQDKLSAFDKGRQNTIEDYRLDKEATADQRDQEKMARERDPNSAESKMAQELALKMGYKGDVSQITAQQFQAFSPALQKSYEIAEKSLDRQERQKDRQLQREIALGQRAEARRDKLEKEARPSEKQVKEFTEFDNALDSIKSIRSQKGQQDTGPLSALQSNVAQFFGMDDSEKSAFKSQVQDQLAQYIKSISGGAVSDEERASLMQNIPKMSDNDETFNAKLDALEERLERNRQNAVKNAQKQGKNVQEFEREPNRASQPRKIKVSNGEETLEIDESDLADAEKDGYKRI